MKGHIRKRYKSSWSIVVDLGLKPDGKRNQVWKSIKGTKREAEAELVRVLKALEDGVYIESSKVTVSGYLDQWLKTIKCKVASTTYERYEGVVNHSITPYVGGLKLNKLQPAHISNLYSELLISGKHNSEGGLSKRSVLHVHRVLKTALTRAVKWQVLLRNPCDAVDPPKPDKKERQTFSAAETLDLLEKTHGNRLFLPILLAVTTGMRRGEVLGLRWKDIDLDEKRLCVRQSVVSTKEHGIEIKSPKTGSSSRSIALPQTTIDGIRQYRSKQAELYLKLGIGLTPDSMLFDEYTGFNVPNSLTIAYAYFIKSHGFKHVTYHDLRHTHATHLLEKNINPKIVSERLGHSTIALTMNTYSHVMPTMQEEAAKAIEQVLKRT